MAQPDKFCLRWNDFETNISSAFRELRDDRDFFDVTLACENSDQIQAHKVILSACSPFFRSILRRNRHEHPLLYLKGVSFADLQAVLNFMYHGEVNIAQEELNSFLSVAEELQVKGLTQNITPPACKIDSSKSAAVKSAAHGMSDSKSSSVPKSGRTREPPDDLNSVDHHPPVKKSRRHNSNPPMVHIETGEDDIQEVGLVKSEPITVVSAQHLNNSSAGNVDDGVVDQYVSADADHHELSGDATGMEVYGTGAEYADYGDTGAYDGDTNFDSSTLMDSSTGAASADSNKDPEPAEQLDTMIAAKMQKLTGQPEGTMWRCQVCDRKYKDKTKMKHHIETHLNSFQPCQYCNQLCKTRRTLRTHILRSHGRELVAQPPVHPDSALAELAVTPQAEAITRESDWQSRGNYIRLGQPSPRPLDARPELLDQTAPFERLLEPKVELSTSHE